MRVLLSILAVAALVLFGYVQPAQAQYRNWPGGSWVASCRNAQLHGDQFSAQCTATNGAWTFSSISMQGCPGRQVGNNNGRLFCESGQTGPGWDRMRHFPGGSWVSSCDNPSMGGHMFTAQCSTGQGYRVSSIDMRSCPSRRVGNRNGVLFCEQ
jgi:CVNH domain